MSLERDITAVLDNLRRFEVLIEQDRKEILRYAAIPLVETIKSATPTGSVVHRRYPSKQAGARRAARGSGKVISTYRPGNLRGSIEELKNLKRAYNIWVGPRRRRIKTGGPGKGDGYYAHMVEFGTKHSPSQPFFNRSVIAASAAVRQRIAFGFQVAINKFKPK